MQTDVRGTSSRTGGGSAETPDRSVLGALEPRGAQAAGRWQREEVLGMGDCRGPVAFVKALALTSGERSLGTLSRGMA